MPDPRLSDCPIPDAEGFLSPSGTGRNGVLVLGEASGEAEAKAGRGFIESAEAGSVLERAFRKVGYARRDFTLFNAVPTRPPKNYLEGAPWERPAIEWGRQHVREVIDLGRPRVILALGNVAFRATTSLLGDPKYHGISYVRGYPVPGVYGIPVIGSIHPSFLRRKSMAGFSVLMHDIKAAVAFAANQRTFWSPVLWRDFDYVLPSDVPDPCDPRVPTGYVLHPTPADAGCYLRRAENNPRSLISYDIETPRSAVTSEEETDELGDTKIISIQFSLGKGEGIFMWWQEPFISIARAMLALPNDKAVHNGWRFDNPLLEAHGCPVAGRVHDLRWAWKALQPELDANLQAIMSFYGGPSRGLYKHLHQSHPGYYGIRDVEELQHAFAA